MGNVSTSPESGLVFNGLTKAYTLMGLRMGEGFIDALMAPLDPKDFIENESRLEHGKRVLIGDSTFFKSRSLTLRFTITGESPEDFQQKRGLFLGCLYQGIVSIKVPSVSSDTFRLVYKGKSEYGQDWDGTFCNIGVRFEEPNPRDRGAQSLS